MVWGHTQLCSRYNPNSTHRDNFCSVQGIKWGAMDQTQVECVQGKCSTWCTITLASEQPEFQPLYRDTEMNGTLTSLEVDSVKLPLDMIPKPKKKEKKKKKGTINFLGQFWVIWGTPGSVQGIIVMTRSGGWRQSFQIHM